MASESFMDLNFPNANPFSNKYSVAMQITRFLIKNQYYVGKKITLKKPY